MTAKPDTTFLNLTFMPAANSAFTIDGVSPPRRGRLCSVSSLDEMVTESARLRINPDSYRDAEKPAHRKSAKRCVLYLLSLIKN